MGIVTMLANSRIQRFITQLTSVRVIQRAMGLLIRAVVPAYRIGAAVVVFNDQGDILLLKHAYHGQYPWALPGGWVNRRELPDAAVVRELHEETGLTAQIGPAVLYLPTPPGFSLNIFFIATEPRGVVKLSYEATEYRWFSADSLPTDQIYCNTRLAIETAVNHYEQLTTTGTFT
jgi:ADP-ribose pyrophosphatase YjhB (NUDIX family)